MPELPEVQTVVTNLASKILHQKIKSVNIFWAKSCLLNVDLLIDQTILDVIRRGKYIILKLNSGYLVVHLRMTGQLFALDKSKSINYPKHLRVLFALDNCDLLFVDQRKFGRINFYENLDWLEKKLGPEPLLNNFTIDYLAQICQKSQQIKVLLLDQSKIAGLGNIYVDEVLWQAGIHPKKLACELGLDQIKLMHQAIQQILQQAILMQGTTFLTYAFDGDKKGNFLSELKVFNRTKQNCLRCGHMIIKIKVAQRGTHICEACQKTNL